MKRNLETFCGEKNGYAVSKTLRFELIPQGKTLEHIQESGFLEEDAQRAIDYKEMKRIIDRFHRDYYIDTVLKDVQLDWEPLAKAITDYQKASPETKGDKDKILEKMQEEFRRKIIAQFGSDSNKKLHERVTAATPKDLLASDIRKMPLSPEEFKVIESFKGFATYFSGFQENRKNIYSSEEISTAIPFRLVHDNFPKFLQNWESFQWLEKNAPEVIQETEKSLADFLGGATLKSLFSLSAYNRYLIQNGADRQKGIDFYNQLIGGVKLSEKQLPGLNQMANQYWQQHADFAKQYRRVHFLPLYKQILSDRTTFSFILETVRNDVDLKNAYKDFEEALKQKIEVDGKKKTLYDSLLFLATNFKKKSYSFEHIYVDTKNINKLSTLMFGKWDWIKERMAAYAEAHFTTKKEKERWMVGGDDSEKSRKKGAFSLAELNQVFEFSSSEVPPISVHIEDFFDKLYRVERKKESGEWELSETVSVESLANQIKQIEEARQALLPYMEAEDSAFNGNGSAVESLKNYLDLIRSLLDRIKLLKSGLNESSDTLFYSLFDTIYEILSLVVPFYNRVRNYLTQKQTEAIKYKLNFSNATLAAGWDLNKEADNSSILLKQGDCYFLGIVNKKLKGKEKLDTAKWEAEKATSDCYQKMIYKLLPGPNKMLPKIFFATGNQSIYQPPEALKRNYDAGKHKKGDSFDLAFCHQLIDFFKESIKKYSDWDYFDFHFSDTATYRDMSDFYREVADQGYKIEFINISKSKIDQWVEEGKLFLFQIYNKDFASGAKGKPNLHTLYFKNLFSPENLKDPFIKLNGEAELFYREAVIKTPVVHKKESKMINRTYYDEKQNRWLTLPELTHDLLYQQANKKLKTSLSQEEQEALNVGNDLKKSGAIVEKKATHDIIKDRRYTVPKFLFHISTTINRKATTAFNMNAKVRAYLKKNPDVNIIGLDRGERHLLYLSLINQKGEILLQKTFNTLTQERGEKEVSVDYHAKLDQREKDRDQARKSWQTIGKIKELKEGFLSAVIHEITVLMIQYNAIVVMEDLNFGFKRGRFHVEKQVYQKFEKMLIDKLNYLIFKERSPKEAGGVLNGYQLTAPFDSFKKLGKQSGFLFYVRANYTSTIDPKTGFVNMFSLKDLTNVDKKREFFKNFDSIHYDQAKKAFCFKFDYKKWKGKAAVEMGKTQWDLYSNGQKIQFCGKGKESISVDVTQGFSQLLKGAGIAFESGQDFRSRLEALDSSNKTIQFFDQFYRLFKLCLQLRNSNTKTGDDYILSSVPDEKGSFFDSRVELEKVKKGEQATLPIDADANGAYHIALKGLFLIDLINETDDEKLAKLKLDVADKDWFHYRQKR